MVNIINSKVKVEIGLFQKKKKQGEEGGRVEDMGFPGVSKKEHVEFPGVN